jgi:hypothetical protein
MSANSKARSDGITAEEALRIIGYRNFWDDANWMNEFDSEFSITEIRRAANFPWSEDILRGPCPFFRDKPLWETHFAFLGIPLLNRKPLTALRWHKEEMITSEPISALSINPWRPDQRSTMDATMPFRWRLVLKSIVPGSEDRIFENQLKLLPPDYEAPTMIVGLTKDVLLRIHTKERVNETHLSATCDRTAQTALMNAGAIPCVGMPGGSGPRVEYWRGDAHPLIGIGASRKLPTR